MKKGYRKSLCIILVLTLLAMIPAAQAENAGEDSPTQAPVVQVAGLVEMTMAPGAGDPTGLEAEATPGDAPPAEDPAAPAEDPAAPAEDPAAPAEDPAGPAEDPAAEAESAPAEPAQEKQDSGKASPKKGKGSETEKDASFMDDVKDKLKKEVTLLGLTFELWVFVSAAAGVVLLILVLVLLLTRKKRKHRRMGEGGIASEPLSAAALNTDQELPGGNNMLSLDDEPTVNLNEETPTIGFNGGVATVDVDNTLRTVTVMLRLFYGDEYMDTSVRLGEGQQAAVGRAGDAEIQTNPADVSVSHRHGQFSVEDGQLIYTDSSRNGSRFNGLRTLANGESVPVPLNTRCELEIGAHRIWIIARK